MNSHNHDFGWALEQLRQGKKVDRAGWNGKGMYVTHQKGYPEGIPINQNTAEATGIEKGTVCRFQPYLMIKTPCEVPTFIPWVISQADALATDWGYPE